MSRKRTDVTEPPGGRHATAQNQAFAASLRASNEKNEDVFLQGVPSPRLHASLREELAAWEGSDPMAERNFGSLHMGRPPSPPRRDWGAPLPVPKPRPAKSPRSKERRRLPLRRRRRGGARRRAGDRREDDEDDADADVDVSTSTELVPFLEKGLENGGRGVDGHYVSISNREVERARVDERVDSRAALLERRRRLRSAREGGAYGAAQEQHERRHSQIDDPPLTVDALGAGSHRIDAAGSPADEDAYYSHPSSNRTIYNITKDEPELSIDDESFASETISSTAHKKGRQRHRHHHYPTGTGRAATKTSSQSTTPSWKGNGSSAGSSVREQTRVFRMSGMSPRELVIENLRLQDRMTELQDRAHDALVGGGGLLGGPGGDVGSRLNAGASNLRVERSVNVLAATNADLSRRVQHAVLGEASAMARLSKLEEENKLQQQRFAELVEISRGEEKAREAAEMRAAEAEAKLKTTEDRVVRLLSRLHVETQNNSKMKARVDKAEQRLANADPNTLAGEPPPPPPLFVAVLFYHHE
jgi:hypothetical protein